jgi:transposase
LDDLVGKDNPLRVVDPLIEELDLAVFGFCSRPAGGDRPPLVPPADPAQDLPAQLFKPDQSSRRLEGETRRNLEVVWLTGAADARFQDHRRHSSRQRFGDKSGVQPVCVALCRRLAFSSPLPAAPNGRVTARPLPVRC